MNLNVNELLYMITIIIVLLIDLLLAFMHPYLLEAYLTLNLPRNHPHDDFILFL